MPEPTFTTNEWSTLTTKLTLHEKRLWLHKIGVFSVFPDHEERNEQDRNCLFHCISQVLKNTSSSSTDCDNNGKSLLTCENIRKSIINHAINSTNKKKLLNYWKTKLQCEQLLKLIQHNHSSTSTSSYLLTPSEEKSIKDEYTLRMSDGNQCGTIFELNNACNLYQFHVDYLIQISKTRGLYKIYNGSGDYDEWIEKNISTARKLPTNYYLFYYKRYGTCTCGHWQLLSPIVLLQPPPFNFPTGHKMYGKCYLYELKKSNNKRFEFNLKNFKNIEELDNIASNYEQNADKIVSEKRKYTENDSLENNSTNTYTTEDIHNNNEILTTIAQPYVTNRSNSKWNNYSWTRLRTPISKQYQRLLVQRNNKKYI